MLPLKVYRSSNPDWTCAVCLTGQQGIRLQRILAIVDIFPSTYTKHEWGCIQRKIYCLYTRAGGDFFLVEGNYHVITGWQQWHQINREALLVSSILQDGSTAEGADQTPHCTETDAVAQFRSNYSAIIRDFQEEEDPDAIVSTALPWPGKSMAEMEREDDLRHLVNYSTTNSIPDFYGTVARLFGHSYTWDRKRRHWLKNLRASAAPTAS